MNLLPEELLEPLFPSDKATIVALRGDLGAGKTTFTQMVGKILNISENMHSPTFVIMKVYSIDFHGFKNLIHIDAYRLEQESELINLGWNEIVKAPENLIFVEWPENVAQLMPEEAKRISFRHTSENTREIKYES